MKKKLTAKAADVYEHFGANIVEFYHTNLGESSDTAYVQIRFREEKYNMSNMTRKFKLTEEANLVLVRRR